MSSNSLTFRFLGVLSALTVLNVTFFGVNWTRRDAVRTCSVDDVIVGVTRYIRASGALSVSSAMPQSCQAHESGTQSQVDLVKSIRDTIATCNVVNASDASKVTSSRPLITIFTTWPDSDNEEKRRIHNITLRNWSMFKPRLQIYVFTNSSVDKVLAESYKAKVFPILHHNGGGAPVLRWMFQQAKEHSGGNSHFYGYVNSDILFTDMFIQTLDEISMRKNNSKPLLIVGRRTNVMDVTYEEADTFDDLSHAAAGRGEQFGTNAEDFFITNSAYPWKNMLDVVVGRLAYDNWIVAHSLCKLHVDVIDVSDTVLAVHQSTKAGGNFEGFKSEHAHYNNALFKVHGLNPTWENGFTTCAPERTFVNLCGRVTLTRRLVFADTCACRPGN